MTEFIQVTKPNGETQTHLAPAHGSAQTLCGITQFALDLDTEFERVTKPRHHVVECNYCQCIVARVAEYLKGRS